MLIYLAGGSVVVFTVVYLFSSLEIDRGQSEAWSFISELFCPLHLMPLHQMRNQTKAQSVKPKLVSNCWMERMILYKVMREKEGSLENLL